MNTLFLSHNPHEVHLEFAKSINAKIKIIHLNWLIKLTKKFFLLNYFYPLLSLFYSFFIKVNEDFILVDGGSSLYLATFLKIMHPSVKIIFLDGDLFFYLLKSGWISHFFYDKIDAVISVSEQSEQMAKKSINIPIRVVTPYPRDMNKINVTRKNHGLYVGRLDPDKNIDRIIKFGMQCPYFDKFIILGDGAYRDYVKKLSKINKKIIYMGQKEDIAKFYSECKFLIHIPDYDPHPCTTMEAALCGCFPIISKGVGTKYLFDERFIVNNPDNFEEVNSKIKYILDHESKAKRLILDAIKKFPTKEFSIRNFRDEFYKIVNEIKK